VGARPYKKFGRLWVPATWAGLIPSSAGALYLAWWHWHWLGTAAITLSCAVGVVGALLFTAEREKTSASAAVTAGGIGSAAVIALVIAGIYDYRLLVEHHTRYGLVAALASAVGIVGATTMAMLFSAGDTADAVRDAKKVADSDRELAKRISGQRWFGDADAPPDFMQPLFALPAIRGFEFSKRRDTTTFNYALAVGSRVLLISMLASADERPELGVAAASWQSRLGFSGALVKTVLVVNGYELPVLRSDEQFSMTSVMTTSVAFVDTVGHWLDEDNRILLRVVDPLFGGL
jgi:hypothetical protein